MTCDTPYYVLPKAAFEKVPVPCGKCPPCKLRRVNGWVFRLLQEEKISSSAHFVTLTYDTKNVPISDNGFMSLSKRDFQLYMKRLRKLCPADTTLKYYAVGEYGTNNNRPHYHAVIFNVPDTELFNEAWGLGSVHVGSVSTDSIAYTMKYIDKPYKKRIHSRDDREFEFPLMSKGLGKNYLSDQIVKYHKADLSRLFVTKEGGHRISLPRYYRQKIYSEQEQKLQVKIIQFTAEEAEAARYREWQQNHSKSGMSYEAYKTSEKFGRYKNFYSQQSTRDL